jgi:hypothetical protein
VKWRSELILFRDHTLHPLIASLLPWSWTLRYAHWLSRRASRLTTHGERSREGAERALGSAADAAFARRALWIRIVDIIDAPVSLFGADRHMRRHWRIHGQWPSRPCLAVSLHHGNGLFALRHLRVSGHRAHLIAQSIQPEWFKGRPITLAMTRLRFWCVERLMQAAVIYSGGARQRSLDAIAAGDSIVAVLDNPQGLSRGIEPITLFGRRIALHTGIVQLALGAGLPVVPYITVIGDGRQRELHIGPEIDADSTSAVCAELARWFAPLVGQDPAAWHLWPQMQEFEESVTAVLGPEVGAPL